MTGRRIVYLASLAACLVFYLSYQEWLSWLLLVSVLALPWFSLLCSLPAMLRARVEPECPDAVVRGQSAGIRFRVSCPLPQPPVRGTLVITNLLTGERRKLRRTDRLPTEHCGKLQIRLRQGWIYDYLGLLRWPLRFKNDHTVLIRPEPIALPGMPDAAHSMANAWRPKPGGGFSENHELRLYRPGDNLHQLHWKLSAKTGKLILREPMERIQGLALVTMELRGTGAQLDKKLGQLLWVSRNLLEKDIPHQIHCLTADGLQVFHIRKAQELDAAVDALLGHAPAPEDAAVRYRHAPWRCHIGGDSNEE